MRRIHVDQAVRGHDQVVPELGGETERDAWLHHMRVALDELGPDEALAAQLWDFLVMAAHSLVNVDPAHGRPDLGLRPA